MSNMALVRRVCSRYAAHAARQNADFKDLPTAALRRTGATVQRER